MIPVTKESPPFLSDPWLGSILKRPVYRYAAAEGCRVDDAALRPYLGDGVFAYAKVSVGDIVALHALENAGFRLVDTNVTLSREGVPALTKLEGYEVRFSEPGDERGVTELSRQSFRYSRFHLDPAIPKSLADEVKARWAENFFHGGRGDVMAVAVRGGEVIGFLQCLKAPDRTLVIDLFAVSATCRRQGVARAMISHAQARTPGILRVRVGTQLANLPSIRLFESQEYRVEGAQYVLHFHGKRGSR